MSKLLKIALAAALAVCVVTSLATAGLNAGATAKLYWTTGTTGLTIRESTSATPELVVTVKGVSNVAGADVQLLLNSLDGLPVPECWLGNGTGGCADTSGTCTITHLSGFTYQKLFGSNTVTTTQEGMYYNFTDNPCLTPHGVALIWFSGAIPTGISRTTTVEYGIFQASFDQSGTGGTWGVGCPGDLGNSPRAVCINANFRQPCMGSYQLGAKMDLVDNNLDEDFAPFVAGYQWLTWEASQIAHGTSCPDVTPSQKSTWGSLRRLYR